MPSDTTSLVLPNLVIAGVGKAGTTSLFSYLASHRDVCPSSVKEAGYFTGVRRGEALPPLDEYARLFRAYRGERYVLEATPAYFYGAGETADTIERVLTHPHVVVSLRDPVDRAYSFFRYRKSRLELPADLTFHDYVVACERDSSIDAVRSGSDRVYSGVHTGLYVEFIEPWFTTFGERFRVVFFEHLRRDARAVLTGLLDWLELEHDGIERGRLDVHNITRAYQRAGIHRLALRLNSRTEPFFRARPRLKAALTRAYYSVNAGRDRDERDEQTQAALRERYAPANERLATVLRAHGQEDLPGWLRP